MGAKRQVLGPCWEGPLASAAFECPIPQPALTSKIPPSAADPRLLRPAQPLATRQPTSYTAARAQKLRQCASADEPRVTFLNNQDQSIGRSSIGSGTSNRQWGVAASTRFRDSIRSQTFTAGRWRSNWFQADPTEFASLAGFPLETTRWHVSGVFGADLVPGWPAD